MLAKWMGASKSVGDLFPHLTSDKTLHCRKMKNALGTVRNLSSNAADAMVDTARSILSDNAIYCPVSVFSGGWSGLLGHQASFGNNFVLTFNVGEPLRHTRLFLSSGANLTSGRSARSE